MTLKDAAAWTLGLCDRFAAITDVPGETTRLFLSPATREVQALLRAEMLRLGMEGRLDAAGNLRGVWRGKGGGAERATLLLGSHIDTVPNAGRFDGVLGVAVALGVVALLRGRRLAFDLEVIAFSEEEGVRFRLPFIGSRMFVGDFGAADRLREDAAGVSVGQALRGFGLTETVPGASLMTPGTMGFVELHIEQGPVLEALRVPLGVVETIVGQTRYALTFRGQANHAGTTPMRLRRDALAAAAVFVSGVEAYALKTEGFVATVGMLTVAPGAANIVPGEVVCSLDVRHAEDALRELACRELLAEAQSLADARGIGFQARQTSTQASVAMDAGLRAGLMRAAAAAGLDCHAMDSGAGHDAMIVAGRVPAAMLFLRTPGGLSHHPEEAVRAGDVEAGLAVLLGFVQSWRCAEWA